MTDIVERLRTRTDPWCHEAAAEIERLLELLRGTGANRYWEGRWRDAEAEVAEWKERWAAERHDHEATMKAWDEERSGL